MNISPFVVDLAAFARDHALSDAEIRAMAARLSCEIIGVGGSDLAMAPARRQACGDHLRAELAQFHRDHSDAQGIGREALRRRIDAHVPAAAFAAVLQAEARSGAIMVEGAFLRLPEHEVRLSAADETLWQRLAPLITGAARFRPPRVRDLAALLGREEGDIRRLLKLCARLGRVDLIAHDHYFARATTAEMVELARATAEQAPNHEFTAAAFRDRMDNGRKVAIQILDFFDRNGITLRKGDLRRINPYRLDLFGAAPSPAANGRESSPVGRPDFKSGWGSEPVPGGFDPRSLPPTADHP